MAGPQVALQGSGLSAVPLNRFQLGPGDRNAEQTQTPERFRLSMAYRFNMLHWRRTFLAAEISAPSLGAEWRKRDLSPCRGRIHCCANHLSRIRTSRQN